MSRSRFIARIKFSFRNRRRRAWFEIVDRGPRGDEPKPSVVCKFTPVTADGRCDVIDRLLVQQRMVGVMCDALNRRRKELAA